MSRSVLRRSGFLRADRRGRSVASLLARGLAIGLLACAPMAGAQPVHAQEPPPIRADFLGLSASDDAHKMTDWILASGDNRGLPFLIVDKIAAKVFAFGATGDLRGAAPALLGLGIGDESAPDIGQRRLASITAAERTTAAGRFEAALGNDLEQDVLWVDYDSALSLHRVIVGNPRDRRHARLASPTPSDNRISYGCINVPVSFFDNVIVPVFAQTVGIVYILPETKPIETIFALGEHVDAPSAANAY